MEQMQWLELFGEKVLFTEMRKIDVDVISIPPDLYKYDLRHGDEDDIPLTLERDVYVNRFGTIFSVKPLLKYEEEYRTIEDDDWGFLSDMDDATPIEYYLQMKT